MALQQGDVGADPGVDAHLDVGMLAGASIWTGLHSVAVSRHHAYN